MATFFPLTNPPNPQPPRRTPRTGSSGPPAATDDDDSKTSKANLDGHEGAWSGQPDDDDFLDYETRPRPGLGYGECTGCGEWHSIGASGAIGKRGRRGHYLPGAWGRACPGTGQQPARPVPCDRCGQTGLALTAIEGLCSGCLRDRKEAEAEGRAWP